MSIASLLKTPPDSYTVLYAKSFNGSSITPPSPPLVINSSLVVIDPVLNDSPSFLFVSDGVTATTGGAMFLITDTQSAFNRPNGAVFEISAPNSVSFGGGTNFIRCLNKDAIGQSGMSGGTFTEGYVFQVASNGVVLANTYTQPSSGEYKKNIVPLEISSAKLREVEPARYHYNEEKDEEPKRAGIMYEDMMKLCPHACRIQNGRKTVDLSGQNAMLLALLKDLEERVTDAEEKIRKHKL